MLKLSKLSDKSAENLMDAAHSEKSAFECKSYTVAIICHKMVAHWRDITAERLHNVCNDYRATRETLNFYRERLDALDSLAYAWECALSDTRCKTSDFTSHKEFRRAWKQEQRKRELLLKHWDEETGTWNFPGVVFG